jgi:hypothetical protein
MRERTCANVPLSETVTFFPEQPRYELSGENMPRKMQSQNGPFSKANTSLPPLRLKKGIYYICMWGCTMHVLKVIAYGTTKKRGRVFRPHARRKMSQQHLTLEA